MARTRVGKEGDIVVGWASVVVRIVVVVVVVVVDGKKQNCWRRQKSTDRQTDGQTDRERERKGTTAKSKVPVSPGPRALLICGRFGSVSSVSSAPWKRRAGKCEVAR